MRANDLSFAECNSALRQIVRRKLDANPIARHNADKMLPHLAGHVGNHQMAAIELDAETGVRERLSHNAFDFESFFLRLLGHKRFLGSWG